MTRILPYFLTAMVFAVVIMSAYAQNTSQEIATVGQPAPNFTATDINGQPFRLSDQKGKIVVLEWTNHECPFVQKHYGSGNMQKLQKEAREKDVVWVSIVSSAPDRQGHVTPAEAKEIMEKAGAAPTAKILDESGAIGKLYDAKTTPHMYVIDSEGVLAYAGAIDNNPSPRPETIEGAQNYVTIALDALMQGHKIETTLTPPYGCAVKY